VTQSHLSKACSALSGDLRAATGNRALFKSTGVSFKQQIYQAILIQILFAISCCPTTILCYVAGCQHQNNIARAPSNAGAPPKALTTSSNVRHCSELPNNGAYWPITKHARKQRKPNG
jgi:hypothetical protein